jgi:hypothetical protein
MAPDIQRNPDDSITVSFTFKPGDSMLESELNLQAMSNQANALASGECLKRFDTDGSPVAIGGRTLTSKGLKPKKYQTPYGAVSVSRHLYQSSLGGATYCPMEFGARIVRTATPLLAKQASFKLAAMNSNLSISDFRQYGLTMARSYLKTLVADVASIVSEKQDHWQYAPSTEELGCGKRVKTISLGVDGTCALFCAEGYREVMVGTLALYDDDGERLHTTYVAQAPEYGKETFFAKMDREVDIMKGRYPEARWVGIADGAHSHWPWLEEKTTWQAVDFWHVSEYLSDAAKGMARGKKQQEQWLEDACHRLKHEGGAAEDLLEAMQVEREEVTKGSKAEALNKAISYFENHHHRMNYSLHVAMDLPIGSGVTEAGCKTVVKQRMCGSGMKWQMPGAKQILDLRAMILTGDRWEQFWQKVSQFGFSKISGPNRD